MKRRSPYKPSLLGITSATWASLCLVLGFTLYGSAASANHHGPPVSPVQVASQFAIADFDGDSRPDLAIVQVGQIGRQDTHYSIGIQLSTGGRQTVGVTAPSGGLRLDSRDVNGDKFLDVIVTTVWTNLPVAILLNDGRGNFSQSDPSTFEGAFWTSDTSWTSPADTEDADGVLLPRHSSGDCEEARSASSSRNPSSLLVSVVPPGPTRFRIVTSLGRAPPSVL